MTVEEQIRAVEARLRKGGDWLDNEQAAGKLDTPYFQQQLERWVAMLDSLGPLYARCTHPLGERKTGRCGVCGQDAS